jgi:hypothetical protein
VAPNLAASPPDTQLERRRLFSPAPFGDRGIGGALRAVTNDYKFLPNKAFYGFLNDAKVMRVKYKV